MHVLDKEKGKTIILRDGDEIEVMTLKGNPVRIQISCKDGTLLVDEVTEKRIKEIKTEQEQVKSMNEKK